MNSKGEPPPEPAIEDLEELDDLSEMEAGPDLTVGPPGSRKCRACRRPLLPGTRQCPGCGASIPKVNPWDFVLVGGASAVICGVVYLWIGFATSGFEETFNDPQEIESFQEFQREAADQMAENGFGEDAPWPLDSHDREEMAERIREMPASMEGAMATMSALRRLSAYGALFGLGLLAFGFLKLLVRR